MRLYEEKLTIALSMTDEEAKQEAEKSNAAGREFYANINRDNAKMRTLRDAMAARIKAWNPEDHCVRFFSIHMLVFLNDKFAIPDANRAENFDPESPEDYRKRRIDEAYRGYCDWQEQRVKHLKRINESNAFNEALRESLSNYKPEEK